MSLDRNPKKKSKAWIPTGVVAVVVLLVGGLMVPWPLGGYPSKPRPVYDYAAAVQLAQGLDSANAAQRPAAPWPPWGERQDLRRDGQWSPEAPLPDNPVCRTQVLTHGSKTARVVILVHGYTTCPAQFSALGAQLFDWGYNVLIAPLPYHGLSDRLTDEISRLTATELAGYADRVVDIAQGLGEQVDMVGLSAGGVVTAWAAQNRSDLSLAVVISPAFGFKQIPTPLTLPAMNAIALLPESYTWWDPALQMQTKPDYAYPRYSAHALTQIMRLGFSVDTAAAQVAPAASKIVVVTNGNEPSVNNALTGMVVSSWLAHGALPAPLGAGMGDAGSMPARPMVSTYEFPASLGLPHDLIDPNQPDQKVEVVYPVLMRLIGEE